MTSLAVQAKQYWFFLLVRNHPAQTGDKVWKGRDQLLICSSMGNGEIYSFQESDGETVKPLNISTDLFCFHMTILSRN